MFGKKKDEEKKKKHGCLKALLIFIAIIALIIIIPNLYFLIALNGEPSETTPKGNYNTIVFSEKFIVQKNYYTFSGENKYRYSGNDGKESGKYKIDLEAGTIQFTPKKGESYVVEYEYDPEGLWIDGVVYDHANSFWDIIIGDKERFIYKVMMYYPQWVDARKMNKGYE